jgi:hypothetical protein
MNIINTTTTWNAQERHEFVKLYIIVMWTFAIIKVYESGSRKRVRNINVLLHCLAYLNECKA